MGCIPRVVALRYMPKRTWDPLLAPKAKGSCANAFALALEKLTGEISFFCAANESLAFAVADLLVMASRRRQERGSTKWEINYSYYRGLRELIANAPGTSHLRGYRGARLTAWSAQLLLCRSYFPLNSTRVTGSTYLLDSD